jgi:hypothetical protein
MECDILMKIKEYNIILAECENGYLVFNQDFTVNDLKAEYRPFGYYLVEFANICKLNFDVKIKEILPQKIRVSELEEKTPIIEKELIEFLDKEILDLIVFDYATDVKFNETNKRVDDICVLNDFFQSYFRAIFNLSEGFLEGRNEDISPFIKENLKNEFSFYEYQQNVYMVHSINQIITLLQFERLNFKKSDHKLAVCEVCGRYFLAETTKSKYCENPSPLDKNKTCREFAANIKKIEYQKNSTVPQKLYSKIYKRFQSAIRYNPNNQECIANFELFKTRSKEWKENIKNASATETEYLEWLKTHFQNKSEQK